MATVGNTACAGSAADILEHETLQAVEDAWTP